MIGHTVLSYLQWRRELRSRANGCCERCGVEEFDRRHHGHHIDRDKTNCTLENGEYLCTVCHGQEHYEEKLLAFIEAAANRIGKHHSPETIEKIRVSNLGKKRTAEARENISKGHLGHSAWNKGIPQTEKAKDLIRKAKLGTTLSPEHCAAKSGWHHTDDAKERISLSTKTPERELQRAVARHTRWHTNRGIIKDGCPHCEAV
jgi:hypothetical protein